MDTLRAGLAPAQRLDPHCLLGPATQLLFGIGLGWVEAEARYLADCRETGEAGNG